MSALANYQPVDAALVEAASRINFLELAGRVVADPHRTQVGTAGLWLLANTVEVLWAICLDADGMVSTLNRAASAPASQAQALKSKLIEHAAEIERRMDVLLARKKEI